MTCPYRKTTHYYKDVDINGTARLIMIEMNNAHLAIEEWGACDMNCPFRTTDIERDYNYCKRISRELREAR
jgi:hypothetical protein